MTGGSGQAELDALEMLEAARGRCDLRALDGLWAAVPEQMRLGRFAPDTVPPQYAGEVCPTLCKS